MVIGDSVIGEARGGFGVEIVGQFERSGFLPSKELVFCTFCAIELAGGDADGDKSAIVGVAAFALIQVWRGVLNFLFFPVRVEPSNWKCAACHIEHRVGLLRIPDIFERPPAFFFFQQKFIIYLTDYKRLNPPFLFLTTFRGHLDFSLFLLYILIEVFMKIFLILCIGIMLIFSETAESADEMLRSATISQMSGTVMVKEPGLRPWTKA